VGPFKSAPPAPKVLGNAMPRGVCRGPGHPIADPERHERPDPLQPARPAPHPMTAPGPGLAVAAEPVPARGGRAGSALAGLRPGAGVALLAACFAWSTLAAGVYLGAVWQGQQREVQARAELQALQITDLLSRQPQDMRRRGWYRWAHQALDRLPEGPPAFPERRTVFDAAGQLISGTSTSIDWPSVSAHAALAGETGPLGQVEVTRSLRGPLWRALALALGGSVLAGALALRLGRRRGAAPATDPATLPDVLEGVLFQRAADAIVVLDERGRVMAGNPRATDLLGPAPEALIGQPLQRWLPSWQPGAGGQVSVRAADGGWRPCELVVHELSGHGGRRHLATLRDLSAQQAAEHRIRRMAEFDALTGLPNRSLFRDRLGQALLRAERHGRRMALMFLDLDQFKHINDSLGHDAGDRLLQHVAATLGAALRSNDSVARPGEDEPFTVARLGGDEFTVIVEDLADQEDARRIAERLQQALQVPFLLGTNELVVTTSIGITVYPDDRCTAEDLLKHADLAMYRAKDAGRNAVQFYSGEMNDLAQRRLRLEAELRHALERDEFVLEFQPKADLITRRVTGVEALLRWRRGDQVVATPDVFVPVLEETGLILEVGRWVLEQAARQAVAWRRAGLPWVRVAVNLSGRQLRQGDLVGTVAEVLEISGLPSAQLELELTESMLMDSAKVVDTLSRLSALGVQLAVDDFGTGYSSLSYLKRFNLDTLKIDRRFVQDMPNDPEDNAIAVAVIALARSLKLRVVAEGVENGAQRQFLAQHGCDEMQGYLVSAPLPPAIFERWWRRRLAAEAEVEPLTFS